MLAGGEVGHVSEGDKRRRVSRSFRRGMDHVRTGGRDGLVKQDGTRRRDGPFFIEEAVSIGTDGEGGELLLYGLADDEVRSSCRNE